MKTNFTIFMSLLLVSYVNAKAYNSYYTKSCNYDVKQDCLLSKGCMWCEKNLTYSNVSTSLCRPFSICNINKNDTECEISDYEYELECNLTYILYNTLIILGFIFSIVILLNTIFRLLIINNVNTKHINTIILLFGSLLLIPYLLLYFFDDIMFFYYMICITIFSACFSLCFHTGNESIQYYRNKNYDALPEYK